MLAGLILDMRSVNLAVSAVVGVIAAAFLIGVVPRWLYGASLIVGTVLILGGLYRQRHLVFGKSADELV